MPRFLLSPLALVLSATAAVSVVAEEGDSRLETVYVIGDADTITRLPGSAYLIDPEQLAEFQFADINRMVREVPGLYLLEEDGYGLRPNLGIRGSGSGRSGKLSLMEDSVLIAPAPYSAPEAYYFPTAGRLNSIEVLKGPATLKYGPFTVGGAVNMLSTPIPKEDRSLVLLEAGERGENRLHSYYGTGTDTTGWLAETHQQYADGFREIDRGDGADIAREDYLLKGRLNSAADAIYRQRLDIKLQYSEENSRMSYVGLTDADFHDDPNRRYGFTDPDEMQNRHSTIQLNHSIAFGDRFTLHGIAYYNKFKRDWFKVDGAGSLIDAANGGDTDAQTILDGTMDADIPIKHNNREYESRGLQVSANWLLKTGGLDHDLAFGLRRHRDEVDRFQPTENFRQIDGELIFQGISEPGPSNNRVEEADALSLFAYDEIRLADKLTLTAALRYEDIETEQQRYNDAERSEEGSRKSNRLDEWLPGLGLVYDLSGQRTLLAGVHRGFAPPGAGADDGVGAELSTNYELGARFDNGSLRGDVIAFFSDYENTVQNCSVAVPCPDGADSGSLQLGEAEINGVEISLARDLALANGWIVPLRASYTYTDAEITRDSDDGKLLAGDNLSYLPENVLALSTGLNSGTNWRVNLTAAFQDDMCVDNLCNRETSRPFDHTDSLWVWDVAAHYDFSDDLSSYLKVENLFDEQAIINRGPDGARANKPRTAALGVKFLF